MNVRVLDQRLLHRVTSLAGGSGLFVAMLLLTAYFTTASPYFLTGSNVKTILLQVAVVGIVAIPGAALVLSGYVDLSVGSLAVLAAVIFGQFAADSGPWTASAIALGVATGWGAMNGFLIAYLRLSPIIVTLAGLAAARGVAEVLSGGQTESGFGEGFAWLGNGTPWGVPVPVWIFLLMFLIGAHLWHVTAAGRHMTAVGADPDAAFSLGVQTKTIPLALYTLSGALAGVGGLIQTSQLDGASLSIGTGLELDVLTAILLGGVSFVGGRGSLLGVFVGVIFIGELRNGLILLNVNPFWVNVAIGAALAVAAGLDVLYQQLERLPVGEVSNTSPARDDSAAPATKPSDYSPQQVPASRPLLDVRSLGKRFGHVRAVRDVSFSVMPGQVLGLLGDNGAGKSTVVSMLSGAIRPTEGEILVDGQSHSFGSPREAQKAGIETVFQRLHLISTLNVADNVFLNRELHGRRWVNRVSGAVDRRRERREVEAAFARLGLSLPPVTTKVSAMSGGQRQAVAIARAVMFGGRLVIMDEPSAALGVRQTRIVLDLIRDLKRAGIAVILISHNLQQVLEVADRVVVLRLGEKVLEADVSGLSDARLLAAMSGVDVREHELASANTFDGPIEVES